MEKQEAPYILYLFKGIFTDVKSKWKKALSQEEVYQLMIVRLEEVELQKIQQTHYLIFMFRGMVFVDFAHLRKVNIKNGILEYHRRKTGLPCKWRFYSLSLVGNERRRRLFPLSLYLLDYIHPRDLDVEQPMN